MARKADKMPARNKKNFRPTKAGAGMTKAGVSGIPQKEPRFQTQDCSHRQSEARKQGRKAAQVVLCPFCRSDEEVP